MKILMVSKACVAGPYQRKLEELARCADVQLTVVVPTYWREGDRRIECEWAHLEGYRIVALPLALNGNFHLHFYRRLGRVFDEVKPDLLHADEEPYNLATWQCFRLARKHGAKAVFFTWQNLPRRYPFPFSWFERSIYRQAAHAIAGNAEAVDVLRAKGYTGPATVIPQFGVDPAIYQRQDVAERPAGFHIGFVGRLVEEKGVAVLLQAAAQLPGDWTLTLVGQGPRRPELEALAARLGIAERVRFAGNIGYSEMPRFYSTLDVLALPSLTRPHWKEQFGRVLVEAMACRVPVVGSASGEIPHVIGAGGLTFPEADAAALSEALCRLQADSALRLRLGEAGRARVLGCFTQTQIARATHAVYRQVLGDPAS